MSAEAGRYPPSAPLPDGATAELERDARPERLSPISPLLNALAGLRRHLWLVVAPVVLIPALAALAVSRMPTLYTASGTVFYDPSGYAPEVLQSILRSDPTTDAVMASQVEILRSLSVTQEVARTLGLATDRDFARSAGLQETTSSDPERRRTTVVLALLRGLEVVPLNSSRVLQVSFTARKPGLAAAIVNSTMRGYVAAGLAQKEMALRAADGWLATRAAELSARAQAQDAGIATYRARHGLLEGVQATLGTEEVSRLSADLIQAENDLATAEARRQAIFHGPGGTAAGLAQSAAILREAAATADAAYDAAAARLGPNHPQLRALRDQRDALRGAAGAETGRVLAGITSDARASAARVAALRAELAKLRDQSAAEARANVALAAMQQDAVATRALLQSVLTRLQQSAQPSVLQAPDARVLSEAVPPLSPSSPKRGLLMGAALAAAIVFGLGLAWLRELTVTTLRSQAEAEALLGLPCLGTIPALVRRQRRRATPEDFAQIYPQSLFAAQLRALRVRLAAASNSRILLVTAARPEEGKTTLAIGLARLAATGGERVLLVDCDWARPAVARLMGAGEIGLAELITGDAHPGIAMMREAETGLVVLPAGQVSEVGGADLASPELQRIAATWRLNFGLVILDGPPVLAGPDALLLAGIADGVLLCLRWHDTPRHVVARAAALLAEAAAHKAGRLLGSVLTRVAIHDAALTGSAESDVYSRRYAAYFRE
jgi:polysaccharide biosynthesis transport protein